MARLEKSDGKGEGHYRKRALPLYYAMSRTRANICSVCSNILPPSNPHFSAVSGFLCLAYLPVWHRPTSATLGQKWTPLRERQYTWPFVARHSWISRRDFTPVGAPVQGKCREARGEMVNKSPRVGGSQGLSGCWFGSIALVCFTIQRRSATLFKYSGCTASSWECDNSDGSNSSVPSDIGRRTNDGGLARPQGCRYLNLYPYCVWTRVYTGVRLFDCSRRSPDPGRY
ncbi:hypothetical protein ALC56_00437 [Trachymyrmex septentrionalis]|uniref:Uncharacterized protein n=1 Tax=Trachymyrmex septentrionalis TaxID=34720 RepID=A0A195FY09_9HYME|nr:hypothetical protein ALC56_00437 [Trachymyrmex septentrionalis]